MRKLSSQRSAGFSLIEMAIVMLIMGSLLSGLLVALTKTSERSRRVATENELKRIEEALYGFAQANGRLPCPATSASNGLEDPLGGADVCTYTHGFVPHATLSLYGQVNSDGLLRDPWTNPYRYSVSTDSKSFTQASSVDTLFNDPDLVAADPEMIEVCTENTCADTPLTDIAPAVIFSLGENGIQTNTECGAVVNEDEDENAGAVLDPDIGAYCLTNTMTFVDRTYVEDVFDDVVIWLSPHILFSRLISAGQLP